MTRALGAWPWICARGPTALMRSASIRMPTLVCTCDVRPSINRPALTRTVCGGVWAPSAAAQSARAMGASERTKISGKKTGRENLLPSRLSDYLPLVSRRERLPIRIQEPDLAKIQLPNSRFDLGAIAHDDPHQVIRSNRFLRRSRRVGNRQGADALCIGVEVAVVQPVRHHLLERPLHRTHRLPIAGQREREIRLGLAQLVLGHRLRPQNAAELVIDFD